MSDHFDRLVKSGLWEEISYSRDWAHAISLSHEFELFLNPADAEGLSGYTIIDMPVRQSIGVEQGECLIFDRERLKYIRRDEPIGD
jgi:hypothetical protein